MSNTVAFVPCSAKHKGCTPAHAALVWGYREERARQEAALEAITGGYEGDKALHFARGGARLITFKDWLVANRGASTAPEGQKPPKRVFEVKVTTVEVILNDDEFWGGIVSGRHPQLANSF